MSHPDRLIDAQISIIRSNAQWQSGIDCGVLPISFLGQCCPKDCVKLQSHGPLSAGEMKTAVNQAAAALGVPAYSRLVPGWVLEELSSAFNFEIPLQLQGRAQAVSLV